ncbi:hypothetical protein [Sulfobacillus harzensis]|uniref:Uncharacterized protein n=1 Tax=Sulfobacillus harzensis TaxID=2729629 RepID=A0A7Y0L841_9FIRM|nr:hypothetical protein [Sulfobacillus harzensis]NMP25049.1 hypothetical protein [Sulfobacillus harzensis]
MTLLRTGVVWRSPHESGIEVLIHGELLNNTGLVQDVNFREPGRRAWS